MILLALLIFTLAKDDSRLSDAATKACPEYTEVKLIKADKDSAEIKPYETIAAQELKSKNLVPIKVTTVWMNPNGRVALCGAPENLMLLAKKLVDNNAAAAMQGGKHWTLLKGELVKLVGEPPKEGEEGEGEGEEGAGGDEGAGGGEGGEEGGAEGGAAELRSSKR